MTTTSERAREHDLTCCSREAGQTSRKGPSISRSLLGGFVGTVAITMMMYFVAPMMLGHPMDIAKRLGSLLGDNWPAGMVLHFVNGTVIFPLIYAFLLFGVLPGGPARKGITWGVILWILAQVVGMPMMGAGLFSGSVKAAMGSLIGHVAYGWLLGWIAGAPTWAAPGHTRHQGQG
jgi:uncharacterized membrane protein YagU involved in acid resistance